jgi:hypothetical protein
MPMFVCRDWKTMEFSLSQDRRWSMRDLNQAFPHYKPRALSVHKFLRLISL